MAMDGFEFYDKLPLSPQKVLTGICSNYNDFQNGVTTGRVNAATAETCSIECNRKDWCVNFVLEKVG